MTRDTTEPTDASDADSDAITGSCDHCEWYVIAASHSELVERYQDHLREEHPGAWLRT